MTNYWDKIWWGDVEHEALERAWKKTGFKNMDDLREAVRKLPDEEKIELLTEAFIDEMAQKHFARKIKFLEKLGKEVKVTEEEMIKYAEDTYGSSFEIDTSLFTDRRVCPETFKFIAWKNGNKI